MIALNILVDGDGCWPDLHPDAKPKKKIHDMMQGRGNLTFAGLPAGTTGGLPTVTIRIDLDGSVVLTVTTLALLLTAADVLRARHGDPRT